MCGIAGMVAPAGPPPELGVLLRMVSQLRHRGPDGVGIYRDRHAGLSCTRLSIVDPVSGHQPIPNENETVWVVCNGEIFNAEQLRKHLVSAGHRFRTRSDTEVIVHLYEVYGTAMLSRLNGDFAIALWDRPQGKLLLARDRLGVRPLFFAQAEGALLFASEIKGLLAHPSMHRSLDLRSLDQFFTFWSPIGERTLFSGVSQLQAGHYLTLERGGQPAIARYWHIPVADGPDDASDASEFIHRLRESVSIRLSKDLPNGVYLSGGLDSAAVAYLTQESCSERIMTFSIAFDDTSVDESSFQRNLAGWLGTDHHELLCTPRRIGEVFPDVVRHAEAPLIRMAPVPMYLLSETVRDNGVRIVLTGEGADEFLLGYDWYRAALIDKFVSGVSYVPGKESLQNLIMSAAPPALRGLRNADIAELSPMLEALHRRPDSIFGVHRVRWDKMTALKSYFSLEFKSIVNDYDAIDDLRATLPDDFSTWDILDRAQYLDVHTLLMGYLLSTQGDRMSMAHAVESRVPFLDHTLVEFINRIPAGEKIVGFKEKWPLRRAFAGLLPSDILARSKQSYTAPALAAFFGEVQQEYAVDLMSEKQIASTGIFDALKVKDLVRNCRDKTFLDNHYTSAFVSILSTQVLFHLFFGSSYSAQANAQDSRIYDHL